MSDHAADSFDPDDQVDVTLAAEMLDVTEDRIMVMVDEGLLAPASTDENGPRFLRADLVALRMQGG